MSDFSLAPAWQRKDSGANPPGIATAQFTKTDSGQTAGASSLSLSQRLSKWESGGQVINSALIGDGSSAATAKSSWRAPDSTSSKSFDRFGHDGLSPSWGNSFTGALRGGAGAGAGAGDRLGMDFSGKARERWGMSGGKDPDVGLPSIYNHDLPQPGRPSGFTPRPGSFEGGGAFSGLNGAGRSKGFAAGRGRGIGAPGPSPPGSGFGRPHPHPSLAAALASDQRFGYKYTQAELRRMYDAMLHGGPGHFGTLPVPPGAHLPDYTGVLAPEEQHGHPTEPAPLAHHATNANTNHATLSNGFQVAAGPPPPPTVSRTHSHKDPAPADRAARWTAKGDPPTPPAATPAAPTSTPAPTPSSSFAALLAKAGLSGNSSSAVSDLAPPNPNTNAASHNPTLDAAHVHPTPAAAPPGAFGGPSPLAPGAPGFTWTAATVFAADQWVYRDPQGVVQGPFTKVDILDWFDGGFLPQDLPIKSHMPPDAPYVPLSTMLQLWASFESKQPPPGFMPPVPPVSQQPSLAQQHAPIQPPQPPPAPQPLDPPKPLNPLEALLKQHPAFSHLGTSVAPPAPSLNPTHLGGSSWGAPGSSGPPPPAPHLPPDNPFLAPSAPPPNPFAPPSASLPQSSLGGMGSLLGLSGAPPAATSLSPFPSAPMQGLSAPPPVSLPPFLGPSPWGAPAPPPASAAAPPIPQPPAASSAPPPPPPSQSPAVSASVPTPPAKDASADKVQQFLRAALGMQPQPQPQQQPQSPIPASSMPLPSVASPWGAPSPQQQQQQQQQQAAMQQQAQQQQQQQELQRQQQQEALQRQQLQQQQQEQLRRQEEEQRQQEELQAQQQQQQQQRQVPASKPAPWAEVSAAQAPVSKSLREIQEEEAQQQQQLLRQRQQQQQAAAAAQHQQHSTPPPHSPFSPAAATPSSVAATAGSPWVKATSRTATAEPPSPQPSASQASPPLPGFPALNEAAVQAASAAMRGGSGSAQQQQQQQQQAEGTGPGPRGTTLGDILGRTFGSDSPPKSAAWGGMGGKPPAGVPSLRQVMWRECAADMEGGAPEEDLSDVLPPFGGPQHANSHPADADDGDEGMFWDYVGPKAGPSSSSAVQAPPPPAPAPSSTPWSNIMATAKSAMAGAPSAAQVAALGGGVAPTPRSAPKQAGGWATAVGAGTSTSAAARPSAPPSNATPRPAAAPNSASSSSMQQHALAGNQQRGGASAGSTSATPPPSASFSQSGPPLMAGDVVLSSEFQGWCRNEMLRFFGHTDLSLVEVLVTLPSRSEVADYCSMFMEGKPGVSTFVAEFLKRKDAEVARATAPAKKGSKAKKAAGPPPPTTAASVLQGKAQPAAPAAAAAAAAAPAPAAAPSGNGVRSSEWSQVPVAPPKAKGGAAAGQQKGSKGGAQNTKKSGFNVLKAA